MYDRLMGLIKDNAEELTRTLLRDLLSREETRSYRSVSAELLFESVHDVYSRLDSWLGKDRTKEEIASHYSEMGRMSCISGIPLPEVIMALMLIKRHLWLYVLENHLFDSTDELYRALELNNRVVLFFDRAIYALSLGYLSQMEMRSESWIERLLRAFFGNRC